MVKKIIGFVVLFICLTWIAFVINEIAPKKSKRNFLCYFNNEDSLVLVVHHTNEFRWDLVGFNTLGKNKGLFYEITRKLDNDQSVFISKERPILVVEINQKWTKSKISHLLAHNQRKFKITSLNSFEYGSYIGEYSGKQLIIYPKDYELKSTGEAPFKIDKQASYSIVNFINKEAVIQDVYLKDECKVIYETKEDKKFKTNLVDDRAIFSENLPSNFSSYTFYEKNYLIETDPIFAKSLFHNWIENGLIELIVDDQKIIVFDFFEGQSPIQNLNEALKKEEENEANGYFQGASLKSGPDDYKGKGFFITEKHGFAYLSINKDVIDKVLTEIETNHTLSVDNKQFNALNNYLPLIVSGRTVSKNRQESISRIGTKAIKTMVYFFSDKSEINETETNDYFSMNPGSRITAFCALAGRGNTIIFTENRELHGYINGIKTWSKKMTSQLLSNPIILSFSPNERESIALRFTDNITLIDRMGRSVQNIPGEFILDPTRYLLNDKFQLLCPQKRNLSAYNEQGKVTCNLNFAEDIKDVSVFYEGKKPFCTILTAKQVQLFDLSNNKLIRKTNLPENIMNKKLIENGACVFVENQSYLIIDSKGIKKKLGLDNSWDLSTKFTFKNQAYLLFTKLNQCLLINNNGNTIWVKTFPIREFSSITIATINDAIILTAFDNIENNVYLYDINGVILDQIMRNAESTSQTTAFGTYGQSITTLLGNVLIQYTKY
jgi:hypothetical protein